MHFLLIEIKRSAQISCHFILIRIAFELKETKTGNYLKGAKNKIWFFVQGGNSRLEVQKVRQSTKELQSTSKWFQVC
jgi:hypothetical protein